VQTTNVLFYDAADTLLGFIALNQMVSGFSIANDPGVFDNVSKILLPGGAFYDNLTISAVPEPTVSMLPVLGAFALIRRKRA